MNCREFRRKHDAYVDDTLSSVELDAMGGHLRTCHRCSQLDTRVRRALFMAHNLPTIQPSADFHERLQLRLRHERQLMRPGQVGTSPLSIAPRHVLSSGTYAALAAGLLLVAGIAATAATLGGDDELIRLAPVVASLPEPDSSAVAASTMVAAMPAGIAVWPAVVVAQQAPWQFAGNEGGGW